MRSRKKHVSFRKEESAGAVVFSIEHEVIKALLLVQNTKEGTIEPGPKGKLNRGESPIMAAQRETMEEIGLQLPMDTTFRKVITYEPRSNISKKVTYFLAMLHPKGRKQISLSLEHKKYYLLPIDEAIARVKYENHKEVLRSARSYIKSKYLT